MSIVSPPQRIKLLKTVERAFVQADWKVDTRNEDEYDFKVAHRNLSFFIKCVDETRINYESVTDILARLERQAQASRSRQRRQIITVFDRNFLAIDLDGLISREVFALTVNNITTVTSLAAFSDQSPEAADERQVYLLERCIEYTVFLSESYHTTKNYELAIKWIRLAVDHNAGYSYAYPVLFRVLSDAGDHEAALALGREILRFQRDNPHVLQSMEDLARKCGDESEAAKWRMRLTNQPSTPKTLGTILAKQRSQRESIRKCQPAAISHTQRFSQTSLVRFLTRIFRSSID